MPAAATTAIALLAASAASHGSTTIGLEGTVARSLRGQGVAVARQVVLPVDGGSVGAGAALSLRGRIVLRAGSGRSARRLVLKSWRAQVRRGGATLTAVVGRRRRTLLSAVVPARRLALNASTGAVTLRSVTLKLTRRGAGVLRARLALDRLAAGPIGTLKLTAVVGRRGGSGGRGGGGRGGGGGGGGGGPAPPGCTPGFGSGPITPAPPPLARPAGASDVSSATLTWRPRPSFVEYIASGEGSSVAGGATAGPVEGPLRLVYSFGFALKAGSWYDAASQTAGLLAQGSVRFRYSDHGIDITVKDPEIELVGSRSRAIFTLLGRDCSQITETRGVMLDLTPGAPRVDGATRDYGVIPATITETGSDMFSGFYLPGDAWGSFAVAFTS